MANPVIAVVGSESLLGRELRDLVGTSAPELSLRLIAEDQAEEGSLTRVGDEPTLVEQLSETSVGGARAIILCGGKESTEKALEFAEDTPIVDLTYAAEDRPDARLRAPMVEMDSEIEGAGSVHVIAHPAAMALAVFLRRLQTIEPVRRAVVLALAPASEHGSKGVEELQQQTVSLLSFKSLPKDVFDTQAAYALLAGYGSEAPVALADTEQRIERHLATLLAIEGDGEGVPMPSMRLVQAPVFHGYSFSVWVEFESNPGLEVLQDALPSHLIDVRGVDFEAPTNVSQAGQSGITVGAIEMDRNDAEACWFWLVADNIRLPAENAVEVVRRLL